MNREDRFYDLMEENTDDAGIQYEIGLCYLNGDGTEKDTAEAEKWLTRAANQGHEQAKALLESGNHDTPEKPAETDILELCMKAGRRQGRAVRGSAVLHGARHGTDRSRPLSESCG